MPLPIQLTIVIAAKPNFDEACNNLPYTRDNDVSFYHFNRPNGAFKKALIQCRNYFLTSSNLVNKQAAKTERRTRAPDPD